jgi:DNA-binding beta-propeller fold protein YncE
VFRYPALLLLVCATALAQKKPEFTSPLLTGLRLDPVGDFVDLGSMPVNLVLSPDKDTAVVVLSGWREQGVQIVDLKTLKVTQTLLQDGAFYGAVFSPDGRKLDVSGGNTDCIFVYSWQAGAATLRTKFELEKRKSPDGTGLSYPAGLAI